MTEHARALTDVVKAWESLKEGYYDRDIVETWLADKMKPAIDQARKVLADGESTNEKG